MARKRRDDATAYTFDLVDDDADDLDAGRPLAPLAAVAAPSSEAVREAGREADGRSGRTVGTATTPTTARPPEGGTYRFDLVTDDDEVEVVALPTDGSRAAPSFGVAEARDWVAAHRRVLVPVVGALAAVTIVGAAVGAVREHQQAERLKVAPGGVLSLDDPPEELWRVSPLAMSTIAAVGGDLVVAADDGVRAFDPQTGEGAWFVALESPACGPGDNYWAMRLPDLDQLTCLQGTGDERTVVVVGPEGVASEPRPLDLEAGEAFPGPGGSVVLVRRVGGPADPGDAVVDCDPDASCEMTGTVARARDVEVRVEDGVTGEVRWEDTVEAQPDAEPWECMSWEETAHRLDLETIAATGGPTIVSVDGCGVHAAWTADGAILGGPASNTAAAWDGSSAEVVPGGYLRGYAGPAGHVSRFYGPDGSVEHEFDGTPLIPLSSDGTADRLHLVAGVSTLTAYGADGETLWEAAYSVQQVLTVADGVVVVADAPGRAVALDLGTGETLWDWAVPNDTVSDDGTVVVSQGGNIYQAFTDGRIMMLATQPGSWSGEMPPMISYGLDLGTGDVVWSDVASEIEMLFSVGGHLYGMEPARSQSTTFDSWSAGLVRLG